MIDEGAEIIDLGGESAPGTCARGGGNSTGGPFIQRARAESDALISIDTSKAAVADAALEAGADIVNDAGSAA